MKSGETTEVFENIKKDAGMNRESDAQMRYYRMKTD
jgi:hypothetical protein